MSTRRAGLFVVAALLVATSAWAATDPREVARDSHCERELVICYDRHGELIANDALPDVVHPGDTVTVLVITNVAGDVQDITVTFAEQKNQDHLLDNDDDKRTKARALALAPPPYVALPFASQPVADDSTELTIRFVRTTLPASTRVIRVDLGYSYYSVALLVASTFKGERRVLRNLDTIADHAVDPGLALNVFPFGRQRGVIGYLRKCHVVSTQRCLSNMFGFQLGTDLDLTSPTDKLYTGLVFEPVAGLALVSGVSLRKVQVVPAAGALPAVEAMDGSIPGDSRYVARGYVGITITLDLLDTISRIGSDIRNVKKP
jgi:hypothetical protein